MTETLPSITAMLAMGFFGGVHCLGMCGGIVAALSIGTQRSARQLSISLGYNFGRILGYTLAGALAGGIGQLAIGYLPFKNIQLIVAVIAALMMFLTGLYIGGWSRLLTHLESAGGLIWKRIEPIGRRYIPVKNFPQAIGVGLVWGWIPCGLVYSALVFALSSGSVAYGALFMVVFGLGTFPNLLAAGLVANQLRQIVQKPIVRSVAGLILIGFAFFTLYHKFNMLGVDPTCPVPASQTNKTESRNSDSQ